MVITFFGHSDFRECDNEKEKLYNIICEIVQGKSVDFYLGNYGNFDDLAYECAKRYKEKYKNSKLIFVTPYIYQGYRRLIDAKNSFDEIIFPELEKTPLVYAIGKRNEWMIGKADFVVFYVNRSWGGAAKALRYATKRKKKIINLAE